MHLCFKRRILKHSHVHDAFDSAEVDPNRLQAVIDDSFKSKSFADFKNRIAKAAKVLLPASYVLEELLIKSLAGGDDQE